MRMGIYNTVRLLIVDSEAYPYPSLSHSRPPIASSGAFCVRRVEPMR